MSEVILLLGKVPPKRTDKYLICWQFPAPTDRQGWEVLECPEEDDGIVQNYQNELIKEGANPNLFIIVKL